MDANSIGHPRVRRYMNITFNLPQIIVIVLVTLSILLNAVLHGKEIKIKANIITTIIRSLIFIALLWWGGFFK